MLNFWTKLYQEESGYACHAYQRGYETLFPIIASLWHFALGSSLSHGAQSVSATW